MTSVWKRRRRRKILGPTMRETGNKASNMKEETSRSSSSPVQKEKKNWTLPRNDSRPRWKSPDKQLTFHGRLASARAENILCTGVRGVCDVQTVWLAVSVVEKTENIGGGLGVGQNFAHKMAHVITNRVLVVLQCYVFLDSRNWHINTLPP